MVLDSECRIVQMCQSFIRSVVQCAVRHFQPGALKRLFIYSVAMVLGSDFNFTGDQIAYRMVASAMAELQFECIRSAGSSEQLMAQANAENRNFSKQLADHFYAFLHVFWISRAIRQHDTVRSPCQNFF